MCIGMLGRDELMRLIRTPEEVYADSKLYLDIYVWGLPFVFGISNYTAQNIGAGQLKRIKSGFRAGFKLVWILSVPLMLIYSFAGRQLLFLFMKDPTDVAIQTGINYLRILSPFYFVISVKLVADGVLRGSEMMSRFMTTTFSDLILRVTFAALLSRTFLGATGIWCAWPIGWSVATLMSVYFYRSGPWNDV